MWHDLRPPGSGAQTGRQALTALAEFGVRETARAADHADLPAIQVYTPVEAADGRQRQVHDFGLYTVGVAGVRNHRQKSAGVHG